MSRIKSWIKTSASVAVLAVLAGCSNPELSDHNPPAEVAPPPPPGATYVPHSGPIETTELLGGPSAAPQPPAYYDDQPTVISSAPVPNPEDLSPEDRAAIYGHGRHGHHYEGRSERAHVASSARPHGKQYKRHRNGRTYYVDKHGRRVAPHATGRRGHAAGARGGQQTYAAQPHARPQANPPAHQPSPVKPLVAAPPHIAPAKPVAPVAPPVAAVKPPPVLTPPPVKPVQVAPAKPKTKLEELGLAVAGDVTNGAKLVVPAELGEGKEAVVSLTLPTTLSDRITAEAGKLGLGSQAGAIDVRAILSGDGYTVIPSASQSARLKSGEATVFNWQVTPAAGAHGPLKVDISSDLKGGAKPQTFPIAMVQSTPSQSDDQKAGGAADKSGAGQPGMAKSTLAMLAALALVALIVIGGFMNRASSRRRAAQRRREYGAMTDFHGEQQASDEHNPDHR